MLITVVVMHRQIHEPVVTAPRNVTMNERGQKRAIANLSLNIVNPVNRRVHFANKEPNLGISFNKAGFQRGAMLVMIAREKMLMKK